jgi:2-aminoadipate transaminase
MNPSLKEKFSLRSQAIPPSFIREILKVAALPDVISFAGGLPNPAFFPQEALKVAAIKVLQNNGAQALQYSTTEGHLPLRQWIADFYKSFYGMNVTTDEILITSGSQQGLDMVGKLFLNDGDEVIVERPTYLGAIQSLSQYRANFLEATLLPDGMDISELETLCQKHQPKLCYIIPNFQNPTGACYSEEKRIEVTDLLRKYNILLLEDDPYNVIDFHNIRHTPLKKLYPAGTIKMGSFSKMISPGMRLGWVTAPKEIVQQLTIIKQASDLHTSILLQMILTEYLAHNDLRDHVSQISKFYLEQCECMIHCIDKYLPNSISYAMPKGGMFIWLDLGDIDARKLLESCQKNGVVFVPGDTFYASPTSISKNKIRLNFSNSNKEKIEEGIIKIAKAIKGFIQ